MTKEQLSSLIAQAAARGINPPPLTYTETRDAVNECRAAIAGIVEDYRAGLMTADETERETARYIGAVMRIAYAYNPPNDTARNNICNQ